MLTYLDYVGWMFYSPFIRWTECQHVNETAMPSPSSAVTAVVVMIGSVKSNKGTIRFYSADNSRHNISGIKGWWDWFSSMKMMWWWW